MAIDALLVEHRVRVQDVLIGWQGRGKVRAGIRGNLQPRARSEQIALLTQASGPTQVALSPSLCGGALARHELDVTCASAIERSVAKEALLARSRVPVGVRLRKQSVSSIVSNIRPLLIE